MVYQVLLRCRGVPAIAPICLHVPKIIVQFAGTLILLRSVYLSVSCLRLMISLHEHRIVVSASFSIYAILMSSADRL